MAYSQADLDAVRAKIVSGVDETRDRDQSVKFRSLADLRSIEEDAQADVDAAAGSPHRRYRRIVGVRGAMNFRQRASSAWRALTASETETLPPYEGAGSGPALKGSHRTGRRSKLPDLWTWRYASSKFATDHQEYWMGYFSNKRACC